MRCIGHGCCTTCRQQAYTGNVGRLGSIVTNTHSNHMHATLHSTVSGSGAV